MSPSYSNPPDELPGIPFTAQCVPDVGVVKDDTTTHVFLLVLILPGLDGSLFLQSFGFSDIPKRTLLPSIDRCREVFPVLAFTLLLVILEPFLDKPPILPFSLIGSNHAQQGRPDDKAYEQKAGESCHL